MDSLHTWTQHPLEQDLSTDIYFFYLDPWMTLTLRIQFLKNSNIGHNFLISDWIYFILGHNTPWDKTFQLAYIFFDLDPWMTFTLRIQFSKKSYLGHNFLSSSTDYLFNLLKLYYQSIFGRMCHPKETALVFLFLQKNHTLCYS